MLLRSTLEGYEPDGAGVEHGQNNCCNESGAIVSTLDFWPTNKLRKYTNCDVRFYFKTQSDNKPEL